MGVLDNLKNQRSACYTKLAKYKAQKKEAEQKISRLKIAKKKVASIKHDQVCVIKSHMDKRINRYSDQWSGSGYNTLVELHSDIDLKYKNYYKDVDDVLDSICDEITALENKSRNLTWQIKIVVNTINSISNEIEKMLN